MDGHLTADNDFHLVSILNKQILKMELNIMTN